MLHKAHSDGEWLSRLASLTTVLLASFPGRPAWQSTQQNRTGFLPYGDGKLVAESPELLHGPMCVHGVSARHRGVWAEDIIPVRLLGNEKKSLVEGVNYGYVNSVKT